MIIKCTCKYSYQDKKHGKQMRVMNRKKKAEVGRRQEYRCTVCTSIHEMERIDGHVD